MDTVFVAMSGGVDSSVAASLLKAEGHRVVGITFQLLPPSFKSIQNPKACCSYETTLRARRVADALSIPHYVINLRQEFEEFVIEQFKKEYMSGKTPNPCILCNQFIKFSSFLSRALPLGADYIATGHYARTENTNAGVYLRKGKDPLKDQSYFLYSIQKEQLGRILFPLGKHTKFSVLSMAHKIGWKDMDGYRESQDICFIPGGQYRSFLAQFTTLRKGPVYTVDGSFVGFHKGLPLYTIGQRRGLGIPYSEPLYVVEIHPADNSLIVGPKNHLLRKKLIAGRPNLLSAASQNISGKVRYRQKEQGCHYRVKNGILEVEFNDPVDSITPGQSVVLYNQDILVGGGIIEASAP